MTGPPDSATVRPTPRRSLRFPRWLPPARLLWLSLSVLGFLGVDYLGGLGASALVAIPLVAAFTDLGFQFVRFQRPRFPDAAVATGLFLALIFPPTASLALVSAVAFAAVAARHVLRYRGHPWFNPAASGIVLGVLFLGLAPAWWVGIGPWGELTVVALGGLLLFRTYRSWRLPVAFLAAYAGVSVVSNLAFGTALDPQVLWLRVVDPVTVFFALFMVTEPRCAPSAAPEQTLYAGLVGVFAALFSLFLPTLGLLVALLGGNLLSLALRRAEASASAPARRARLRTPARWPVGYRVGAGILALVVVVAVVGANPVAHPAVPILQSPVGSGGSGGGSGLGTSCTSDNPAIASSTLSTLHHLLGPSVILSYDASTGVVVFYDPVNHVTVTETDLYEDYGFAEFNGDDYAVNGCAA